MTKHTLSVQPRTLTGRAVKKLRSQGQVPASLFGKGITSQNLQVELKEFTKLHKQVGESSLFYLKVSGSDSELPVLIREVTIHPVTGGLYHISFQQVNLKEKVTVPVSIELVGEAPAEAEKLGILVQQLDEIEVTALPTDVPEKIQIDISSLTEVDAAITVGDVKVNPDKVKIETDPESIIVKIEPLAEEEVVPAAPATEGDTSIEGEGETPPSSETPAADADSASES